MATFLPPSKASYTVEMRPMVWVRLEGDIVKPFWAWFRRQDFTQQRSMTAGPDTYSALFEADDARKIGKWWAAWEKRQRVKR